MTSPGCAALPALSPRTFSSPQKGNPHPFPFPLETTSLPSVSLDLPIPGTSYKWNHLCLCVKCSGSVCVVACQNFLPVCGRVMFHCVAGPHFCISIHQYMTFGCFHSGSCEEGLVLCVFFLLMLRHPVIPSVKSSAPGAASPPAFKRLVALLQLIPCLLSLQQPKLLLCCVSLNILFHLSKSFLCLGCISRA